MSVSDSRNGKNRAVVLRLPYRALLIAGGAFLAGLLLFVVVWLAGRGKPDFYTVQPVDQAADPNNQPPLPEPLTTDADVNEAPATPTGTNDGADRSPVAPQPAPTTAAPAITPSAPAVTPAPTDGGQADVQDRSLPRPLPGHNPAPAYPQSALRRGEAGSVVLRVQIDAQGEPQGVTIISRSGSRELDRAAMTAVRKWKFQPALSGGTPVQASVDIPFEFNLQR